MRQYFVNTRTQIIAIKAFSRSQSTTQSLSPLAVAMAMILLLLMLPALASDAVQLTPATQPLAVVRSSDINQAEDLLHTRQGKIITTLWQEDFSAPIPGMDLDLTSVAALYSALSAGKAQNIWYCLAQQGSLLTQQTSAMGWNAIFEHPDKMLNSNDWLEELGLGSGSPHLATQTHSNGRTSIRIGQNSETLADFFQSRKDASKGWRASMATFMAKKNTATAIWFNTRPLIGLLSFTTGVNLRTPVENYHMRLPTWAQVLLANNQGELGFEVTVDNFLPDSFVPPDETTLSVESKTATLFQATFALPEELWSMLRIDKNIFMLANINPRAITPRSVSCWLWRSAPDDTLAWTAIFHIQDKNSFTTQFARILLYLEDLSQAATDSSIQEVTSPWGDRLWKIQRNRFETVVGIADVSINKNTTATFLVAASSLENWPNPQTLRVGTDKKNALVTWKAELDLNTRQEVINTLVQQCQSINNPALNQEFFEQLLASADSGHLTLQNDSLTLSSKTGLLPLLVPAVIQWLP